MKKPLFTIIAVMLCISVYAQKVVGSYNSAAAEMKVEASFDKKNVLQVWFQVLGEYDNEKVMVCIEGEKNINLFIEKLEYCKTKFIEWENVAKTNNITKFSKDFDVTFPNVEIWWLGTKWYSSNKHNYIKPKFLISDGDPSIGMLNEASHWDNRYITQKFYFILDSIEEIDGLIKVLNPDYLKKELSKEANADALFQ